MFLGCRPQGLKLGRFISYLPIFLGVILNRHKSILISSERLESQYNSRHNRKHNRKHSGKINAKY
jgi:hypothetical protein